jgi:hypothetical protein
MKVVFSDLFRHDLQTAVGRYTDISPRLGEDFNERVKAAVRTIIRWEGGDHVGPHGFPCRRCLPFPYLLYYQIDAEFLYVLGLVHERRHPGHLKKWMSEKKGPVGD